jgi:threonine dehydrogenase-like Zn-dependent dehydrogenase
LRELELIGTLMYTMRDFQEALVILSEADFPAASLIGRTFALDEADEAFEYARNNKKEIKIIFGINPEV